MRAVETGEANSWKTADRRGDHLAIRAGMMKCVEIENTEASEILGSLKRIDTEQEIQQDGKTDQVDERIMPHQRVMSGEADIRDQEVRREMNRTRENMDEGRKVRRMAEAAEVLRGSRVRVSALDEELRHTV